MMFDMFPSLVAHNPIDSLPEGPYLTKYVNNVESVIPSVRRCPESATLYHVSHIFKLTRDLEEARTDRERNDIMVERQARLLSCREVGAQDGLG